MIKLYQAEWCPHSHKIRQRLTELELPFIALPVPAITKERTEVKKVSGQCTIPVVVLEDGTILKGKDKDILARLDVIFPEPPGAEAHKQKAIENEHKLGYSE